MRFDDFLRRNGIVATAVDRFTGFLVSVELPPDWVPVDSITGMRLWAWGNDPYVEQFCATAVLTMNHIDAPLDPSEAFGMLCEQQVKTVPGSPELLRNSTPDRNGVGYQGWLVSQFDHELGPIDSVSESKIIADDEKTQIAQLTVTALHESPVDWSQICLSVLAEQGQMRGAPVAYQAGNPLSGVGGRS